MTSIARSQMIRFIVGGAIMYALAAVVVMLSLRIALIDQLDRSLAGEAGLLAALMDYDPKGVELEFLPDAMPRYTRDKAPYYFQTWIVGDETHEIKRSPSHRVGQLPFTYGPADEPAHWSMTLPDGRRGRAAGLIVDLEFDTDIPGDDEDDIFTAQGMRRAGDVDLEHGEDDDEDEDEERFLPEGAEPGEAGEKPLGDLQAVVVVACGLEEQTLMLARVGAGVVGVGIILVGMLALLAFWTVRRGMAPIAIMGHRVSRLDSTTLGARFEDGDMPEELAPLAGGVNELLARLEDSFERERVSSAVLAHELRTPIAEMISAADVATRWPDDQALATRTIASLRETAHLMHQELETLLRVSRIQSGQLQPVSEEVDISAALTGVCERLAPTAKHSSVALDTNTNGRIDARTDPEALDVVLANLISNAIAHSPADSRVDCRLAHSDGGVTIEIANPAPGLTNGELARLQAAFSTGVENGRAGEEHYGLGLALVRSLCRAINAQLHVQVEDGKFIARLALSR